MPSAELVDSILDKDPVKQETPTHSPYAEFTQMEKSASQAILALQRGEVTGASLDQVLDLWKYSFERSDDTLPVGSSHEEYEHWITAANAYTRLLGLVVNGDASDLGVTPGEHLSHVQELLAKGDVKNVGLFAEYLAQRVYVCADFCERSKLKHPDPEGVLPKRPFELVAQQYLQTTLEQVYPVLQEHLGRIADTESGTASIRRVFEHLQSADQQELCDRLLLSEDLSDQQRLSTAVEYINVYGFIPAVELISAPAKTRDDIKVLYQRLQGDSVGEVMQDLWEVYQKYEIKQDFGEYYQDEVTKKDLELVTKWSELAQKRFGKSRDELNVVSLAAGKGRMAFAMESAGFHVVAVEPQQQYAQAIEKASEGKPVRVVQKKWGQVAVLDLSFEATEKDFLAQYSDAEHREAVGGKEIAAKLIGPRNLVGVEVGESTGRNLPHGNTPQRLLEAMDSIRTISKDGAVWVIDVMDPYSGRYYENIRRLRQNLLDLGVDPYKANFTFEGPSDNLKFNRMTVSTDQMRAYAELTGMTIRNIVPESVGEGEDSFKNVYYVLEVNRNFVPQNFSAERLHALLSQTGLTEPGVDLNAKVSCWDMSIGQALIFGFPDTPEFRHSLGDVRFARRKGHITLEATAGQRY